MATFTIELWKVLDMLGDTGDGHTIGLSDYPIPSWWTETDRDALNAKIIRRYYTREIGMETISMFEFAVKRRMHEVMPLYCQVYDSTRIEFDPLATFDLSTVRDDTAREQVNRTSTSANDATTTSGSRAINSDFPQTMLAGDEDYATAGADSNANAETRSTGNGADTSNGTTDASGTSRTTGYQGSAADLLLKYRATILNVDMLVLDALSDCFMRVWDNGEEFLAPADYSYTYGRNLSL